MRSSTICRAAGESKGEVQTQRTELVLAMDFCYKFDGRLGQFYTLCVGAEHCIGARRSRPLLTHSTQPRTVAHRLFQHAARRDRPLQHWGIV
jgi:hypothetical protein